MTYLVYQFVLWWLTDFKLSALFWPIWEKNLKKEWIRGHVHTALFGMDNQQGPTV